tara:strand:+ start:402 stop:740 length:339 start_codon:yes stop_codon:yes gene_type:complete
MEVLLDAVSWICLIAGSAFALIGAVGIIRLPDVFTRMHAAGIIDTLGAGLILAGLIVQAGFTMVSLKLFLIVVFVLLTSPTSTHALARATLNGGVKPMLDDTNNKEVEPSKT